MKALVRLFHSHRWEDTRINPYGIATEQRCRSGEYRHHTHADLHGINMGDNPRWHAGRHPANNAVSGSAVALHTPQNWFGGVMNMQWLKRLFCQHLNWSRFATILVLANVPVEDHRGIMPPPFHTYWYCKQCGRRITRRNDDPPVQFVESLNMKGERL
jgi:hypothetical protein